MNALFGKLHFGSEVSSEGAFKKPPFHQLSPTTVFIRVETWMARVREVWCERTSLP
jgi:hypothetical protein